ncbi:MAG: adenylosuccinate lyase family protein [Alphaproteobacteria bacterium]|nr:adenylosuccinate lyase family protein [Alphaproteobacteria bacterium]MCB9930435.1 adenylosuccinate lyase family protein [Alphaproteobacteria bacterium]
MPVSMIDSAIFRDFFGTEAMRACFSDEAILGAYCEVEAALARVQARLGLIPQAAADAITLAARVDNLDLAEVKRQTEIVGYPILPLVRAIAAACEGRHGEYAHWGATTQDIMDSGIALQLQKALALVGAELDGVAAALARLAVDHRDTVMAGRTHLQHALPVTFGYKAGVWLSAIDRHRQRLEQLRPRVELGQFAGAAGTLASLGQDGMAVSDALMAELGLCRPSMPWHVARDGVAEAVNFLGLVSGSLSKIATDIMLMMTTEVGEAFEPFVPGRGGSSTMPQKRNPISCELILGASKVVRQHAAVVMDAMAADFERATGPWHVEWIAVPEAFVLAAGALHQARFMLEGLQVQPERMRRNLAMTGGLIVSEAVMMGLAPTLGRQTAHDVVYDACRVANEQGLTLLDALRAAPAIAGRLPDAELARLCDPVNYLGQSRELLDRFLAERQ